MIENVRALVLTLIGTIISGVLVAFFTMYMTRQESSSLFSYYRYAQIPIKGAEFVSTNEQDLGVIIEKMTPIDSVNIGNLNNLKDEKTITVLNIFLHNSSSIKATDLEIVIRNAIFVSYKITGGIENKFKSIDAKIISRGQKIPDLLPYESMAIFVVSKNNNSPYHSDAEFAIQILSAGRAIPVKIGFFGNLPYGDEMSKMITTMPFLTMYLLFHGIYVSILALIYIAYILIGNLAPRYGLMKYSTIYNPKKVEYMKFILDEISREQS